MRLDAIEFGASGQRVLQISTRLSRLDSLKYGACSVLADKHRDSGTQGLRDIFRGIVKKYQIFLLTITVYYAFNLIPAFYQNLKGCTSVQPFFFSEDKPHASYI